MDELLLHVKVDRDLLSFGLTDKKKGLVDVDAALCIVNVEKKALLDHEVKNDTEICFLCADVTVCEIL